MDLATGTGNAALLAAGTGAVVTSLDSAPRLIDVARVCAATEGVEASFVVGDLQALPLEDGSFDVALSVFGLIFATDARRAFGEMMRVLRPSGRALLSVWIPPGQSTRWSAPLDARLRQSPDRRPIGWPGTTPAPWASSRSGTARRSEPTTVSYASPPRHRKPTSTPTSSTIR